MATNYSPAGRTALDSQIQGMRAAKAAFQALPEVTRDRLNAATEITVREITRLAKATLAASPAIRTRSLQNAVAWTMNRKNGRGRVGVANVTTAIQVGGKTIRVRGNLVSRTAGSANLATRVKAIIPRRYAHLVEFGARHFPAEPFMWPAAEAERGPHLDRYLRAGRQIEQDLSKIGNRHQ